MTGKLMSDDDERHAGIPAKSIKEMLEGVQAPGRRAYPDDRQSGRRSLPHGSGFGAGFGRGGWVAGLLTGSMRRRFCPSAPLGGGLSSPDSPFFNGHGCSGQESVGRQRPDASDGPVTFHRTFLRAG